MELTPRFLTVTALGGGALCVLLALIFTQPIMAVIAAFFFTLSLVIHRFGSILLPYVLKRIQVVETRGSHSLKSDAIVLRVEDRFLASVFLRVDVTESPSIAPERQPVYALAFEKMISALRFPVKYSVLVYALDVEKYRDDVVVKRLEAEIALDRLKKQPKPDVLAMAREERKLVMYSRLLERLSTGEKPLDVEYTVMTTAQGISEEQAVQHAKRQAAELKAVVANALNASVSEIRGEALRQCIDWEFFLPPSYEAFKETF